ncbi:MAG: hypothetical protein CL865_12095 [Cycloclasticus sp.]|nr:hypothetical protein [Cycloclasticus sp.]
MVDYYVPASQKGSVEQSIRDSWHLFIQFANDKPLIYSFINSQIIKGQLPESIDSAFQALVDDLAELNKTKALTLSPFKAAQLLWAGANGAATAVAAAKARPEVTVDVSEQMLAALLKFMLAANE